MLPSPARHNRNEGLGRRLSATQRAAVAPEPLETVADALLQPLVGRLVEHAADQLVGKVVLVHIGVLVVVRVQVPAPVAVLPAEPSMGGRPEVEGYGQATSLLDLGERREVRRA